MTTTWCGVVVIMVFVVFCVISTVRSATTDWILKSCTQDSNCTSKDSNAGCFNNKCLCQPSYFYSIAGKNCIVACSGSDLQSAQLLKYPGVMVTGRATFGTLRDNPSKYQCKQACSGNSTCVSATHEQSGDISVCYLQSSISSTTVMPYMTGVPTHTHFQKRCA